MTAAALDGEAGELAVGDADRWVSLYDTRTGEQRWSVQAFTEQSYDDVDYEGDYDFENFLGGLYVHPSIVAALFGSGINDLEILPSGDVAAASSAQVRVFGRPAGEELVSLVFEPTPVAEGERQPAITGRPWAVTALDLTDGLLTGWSGFSVTYIDADLMGYRGEPLQTGRLDTNILAADVAIRPTGETLVQLTDGRVAFSSRGGAADVVEPSPTRATSPTAIALAPTGLTMATSTASGIVLTSVAGSQLLAAAVDRGGHHQSSINPAGTHVALGTLFVGVPAVIAGASTESRIALDEGTSGAHHDLAAYVADDHLFAYGPEGIFDLDPATLKPRFELPQHDFGIAIAPDGESGVMADWMELRFVDMRTGKVDDTIDLTQWSDSDLDQTTRMSSFTPDGSRLIVARPSGRAVVIDVETREVIPHVPEPDGSNGITAARFSPDGTMLATQDSQGSIEIRDPETLEVRFNLPSGVTTQENLSDGPYFSPDSRYLLTTRDKQPRVWDVQNRSLVGTFANDLGLTAEGSTGPEHLNLVTLVGDHALIWNLNVDEWPEIACRAAGRNLKRDEWDQFGPQGEPYRATCEQWPAAE